MGWKKSKPGGRLVIHHAHGGEYDGGKLCRHSRGGKSGRQRVPPLRLIVCVLVPLAGLLASMAQVTSFPGREDMATAANFFLDRYHTIVFCFNVIVGPEIRRYPESVPFVK